MKFRQASTVVICIFSIFMISLLINAAHVSINAAATAGKISLVVLPSPPIPKTVCGNGICEADEMCPADCVPEEEIIKSVSQIKFTYMLLVMLVVIICFLAYFYFKEDRPPITGYWQYGFR